MKINENCKLFLRDVYSYDISACHYNIVKDLGLDLSGIDENDKAARNIKIGIMMRDNPKLTSIIRNITESTIGEYLLRNKISDDELITRQYDGVIITKIMNDLNSASLPIELKEVYQNFIISINRKYYIAFNGSGVVVKGISNKYEEMNKIYEKIVKLNFLNKAAIFKGLERIKYEIFNTSNPLLYCIPDNKKEKFSVILKKYGQIEIGKSATRILDTDDINKQWYFDYYIKPFSKSLTLEFV